MKLAAMSKEEVGAFYEACKNEYDGLKAKNLHLDMTRGKPCAPQLDLALGVLEVLKARSEFANSNGDDSRNYGIWNGLKEMREIFGGMLELPADQIILGNNSSLEMMFECITQGYTHGFGGCTPWCKQEKLKFLCPVPGYDRHFAITAYYGIEMITIPMLRDGPDMDLIEKLVEQDDTIKGCWCVPKYSNPTGITYSDEVVRRFARLKPAAKDFRIMWDNAYCVHDLTDTPDTLLSLYAECEKNGTEDMALYFASTSKISFPGAGVAALGLSTRNMEGMRKRMTTETIGPDKLNQLRHILYFRDLDGIKKIMQGHRDIIAPKFNLVNQMLEESIGSLGIAAWNKPNGGYFINLDVMTGCAKRVVMLCKEAGVSLTNAGATYPYGKDPNDSNIRLAPTFPPISELEEAMRVVCVCIKLAVSEKLLQEAAG